MKHRYAVIAFILSVMLALFANIFYTNYAQRQTEQKFCGVMRIFDAPTAPPTTARAKEIQERFHQLRKGLSC
jgi:hypothetical protein